MPLVAIYRTTPIVKGKIEHKMNPKNYEWCARVHCFLAIFFLNPIKMNGDCNDNK